MTELISHWLMDIGLIGLFAAMFLEGSSLPFPGIAVVIAYGYILPFEYFNPIWIAAGMSLVYSLASLIPYYLGSKLEKLFLNHPKNGIKKAWDFFNRYGFWSVAVTRPFGLGNYISYVAGMSKMRLKSYLIFTFIGIYPWSYGMILLGKYFKGSHESIISFYQQNGLYFFFALAIFIGTICVYLLIHYKKNQLKTGVKKVTESA